MSVICATATLNEDAANVAVTGLSISDVDATLAPAGIYEVTLSATAGTLTLTTLTGLTFSGGSDGTADATMTFRGTLAQVNAALATVTYNPTANYNGSASLSMTSNDLGNSGSGGAKTDTDAVAITVNAVNDAPTIVKVEVRAFGSTTWVARSGTSTANVASANRPMASPFVSCAGGSPASARLAATSMNAAPMA